MTEAGAVICWQLVRSTAGRDADQWYLVLDVGGDGFVLLADGERRRIENPKRKNLKHLKVFPRTAEELAARAAAGGKVTDAEVRRALAGLVAALSEEQTGPAGGCRRAGAAEAGPGEVPR